MFDLFFFREKTLNLIIITIAFHSQTFAFHVDIFGSDVLFLFGHIKNKNLRRHQNRTRNQREEQRKFTSN